MLTHRARSGERGAVLVFVAPLFLALFGITAIVVDIGNARQEARHVQGSVDAASLAGARELPLATASTTAAGRAKQQAAKNVNINITGSNVIPGSTSCTAAHGTVPANSTCYSIGNAEVVVATPYLDAGAGAPASFNLVFVRVCRPTATFFASTIGQTGPKVCRDAVGRRVSSSGGYPMGLVVIHPTACPALIFGGTSETVLSSNGAVMVNSNCTTNALDATGSAWDLQTGFIGVVGGASLAPCDPVTTTACTSTEPTENITPFDDPYGHITAPLASSFSNSSTYDATAPNAQKCAKPTEGRVLEPGRYQQDCDLNDTAGYIFRPGVYYFDKDLSTNGSTRIVCHNTAKTMAEVGTTTPPDSACDGVTFIVGGSVSMNGNAEVWLPPSKTGSYAGITLYQLSSEDSTINGTSHFYMGSIYAPAADYTFTGASNTGPSNATTVNIYGMVVTQTAEVTGNFTFDIVVPEGMPEAKIEDDFGLWE